MKFRGNLLQHGRAVAHGVTISVRVHGGRWHGEIQLPKGASVSPGSFMLQLSDRRSGRIMIDAIDGETAYFNGDGALKKQ